MSTASDRNKQPILDVLKQHFASDRHANVLEISSGDGTHVAFFASHFANLTFQPSEYGRHLLDRIAARVAHAGLANVRPPLYVDVSDDVAKWHLPDDEYAYVVNINMMHVAPPTCADGLFRNAGKILRRDGLLVTYGPYAVDGVIEPESNVNFDRHVRQCDPSWGLRDIRDLEALAADNGLRLERVHEMPANNKTLIWRKI